MKTKTSLALLLFGGCLATTSHAADPVVYKQQYTTAEDTTWDSVVTPTGFQATAYDNFSISAATNVTAVQWQGTYLDHNSLANNPTPPNATAFTVAFWADNSGVPGRQLATATIPLADCAETSLGTVGFNDFNDPTTYRISYYTYRATLPTPFLAAAGQTYWMSVVGIVSTNTPIWSWYASTADGNTTCVQDANGSRLIRPHDRAFALEGVLASVPGFFTGQSALENGVYYLSFPNGNYFGYYSFLSDTRYIYHFDLGYEYVFDANDGKNGIYFYDFKSQGYFYTSPSFPFPYLYDFSLNSTVYYYPDPANPGRYNTGGVRYFYVFSTGRIISK